MHSIEIKICILVIELFKQTQRTLKLYINLWTNWVYD